MGATSELYIRMQDEVMNLTHRAVEGELSHLDALIEMRKHREECEKTLELIKDYETSYIDDISNEAEKYQGIYHGFEIKKINGCTSFSFKNIPVWQQAEENKKAIEEQYKLMYQAKMKGVEGADLDPETGELLPLPEVSYGKSYLTVKAKK